MSSVRIIHSCSDFVVAIKNAKIHSAPLQENDTSSALVLVAQEYPEILKVRGKKEIEGGLVHRIDYDTAGLLLFACNQKFYDHILTCQEAGLFKKNYLAFCNFIPQCPEILGGFPPTPFLVDSLNSSEKYQVLSAFRPFGPGRKEVRPVTEDSVKFSRKKINEKKEKLSIYSTNFTISKVEEEIYRVEASITKGYRHQVRCHLAWCSLPIISDPLYNPTSKTSHETCNNSLPQMQFFATGFSFPAYSVKKDFLSNREDGSSSMQFNSFSISPEEILKL